MIGIIFGNLIGGALAGFVICALLTVSKISDLEDECYRVSQENEVLRKENIRLTKSDCKGEQFDKRV